MESFCRDCFRLNCPHARCDGCGSPRVLSHPELFDLSIAHMDCDAFYASVEKRDNPELRNKPLIIGGGRRGVVSTACYVARIRGVKSAMPMFQALKLCPEAVVVKPRMERYVHFSKKIKAMMEELSPAIEPLSLDEAFIDLSGTAKLHGFPPAVLLAKLVKRMEQELGLTGSIGLSHNKFLAKIASDLDKPNGFSIIGLEETERFLADKPIKLIWGVGASGQGKLHQAGIYTFQDLLRWDRKELSKKFGQLGDRLWSLARGQDHRAVEPRETIKSISHETTFHEDTKDRTLLKGHLWRMSEKVSDRAKAKELEGSVVTLKLKSSDHKIITRRLSLREPTQFAHVIYDSLARWLDATDHGISYRLLGAGLSGLQAEGQRSVAADLLDEQAARKSQAERASDEIRAKFGTDAIVKGRALR